jgi:hypothetical protein
MPPCINRTRLRVMWRRHAGIDFYRRTPIAISWSPQDPKRSSRDQRGGAAKPRRTPRQRLAFRLTCVISMRFVRLPRSLRALSRPVCHRTCIPDCTARPSRVATDFGAVASGHPLLQKTRPSRSALTYVKARILWRAIISSFCDNFHPGPSRFNGGVAHPVRRATLRRYHQSQWEEIDGDREQTVNWH